MTVVGIHQPQYLPWRPYLDKVDRADVFVLLDDVQFHKGGVQNRNMVKTNTGGQWLTIPVHASLTQSLIDTRISGDKWKVTHVRTLRQAYARAPFVDLVDGLDSVLNRSWTGLAALNAAVLQWLLDGFGIDTSIVTASSLGIPHGDATERLVGICQAVGATRYLSGRGAAAYQDDTRFAAVGIDVAVQQYQPLEYPQLHGDFLADLSSLDLLLNTGPDALHHLRAGRGGE